MSRKQIAFIGTREPNRLPREWVALYDRAVRYAAAQRFVIRTGAAVGADQQAASIAMANGAAVHLCLPWRGYEEEWVSSLSSLVDWRVTFDTYAPSKHPEWAASVHEYHPRPDALSRGAFALHARNYGIVQPARIVVALPSQKPGGGGTGQGMRIAAGLGIRLFDLSQDSGRAALEALLPKGGAA